MLKKIYRTVSRIRHFEEQGIKLYRQGLIKGYFHPYLGQEGIAAGVCAGLQAGEDYGFQFSMLGPADTVYDLFLFDALSGRYLQFNRDTSMAFFAARSTAA